MQIRRTLLSLALFVLSSATVIAADWIEVYSGDEFAIQIDQSKIRRTGGDSIDVWERWIYSSARVVGSVSYRAYIKNSTYKCRLNEMWGNYTIYYDNNGSVIDSWRSDDDVIRVVPGSIGESVFDRVCASNLSPGTTTQPRKWPEHQSKHQISCSTAGESSKCGEYEHCVDHPDRIQREAIIEAMFGPGARGPVNLASCDASLSKTLHESNCMADNDEQCQIYIAGEITADMALRLRNFVNAFVLPRKNKFFSMYLESNGGDVDAAILIGEMLRSVQAAATVRTGTTCASACVLVLAGASARAVHGDVIIHRPYRREAVELGPVEAQRQFDLRNKRIRTYLEKMNVSDGLLVAMNAIPPEKGRTLSEADLESYGLVSVDPVFQEEFDASNARRQGITVTEYLVKKRAYDECVQGLDANDPAPGGFGRCMKLLDIE